MRKLRFVHQLVPARISGNLLPPEPNNGIGAAEEPLRRNWERPNSCLATGWRSVFMGTYDTWSERPVELSVTSETYRAMYGTHLRIDGTTAMGWLTAIVRVLPPLDGSWRTAASS
jgi:hypothetical protein